MQIHFEMKRSYCNNDFNTFNRFFTQTDLDNSVFSINYLSLVKLIPFEILSKLQESTKDILKIVNIRLQYC